MKKTWFLITLLTLMLIAAGFFIARQQARQKPITVNSDFLIPNFSDYTTFFGAVYTGTTPYLPTTLPLLSIQIQPVSDFYDKLDQYCQTYQTEDISSQGYLCNYNAYDGGLNPQIYLNTPAAITTLANLDQILITNQTFLRTFFTSTHLQPNLTQTNYLIGDLEVIPAPPEQATVIGQAYDYQYSNIPILPRNLTQSNFYLLTNGDQQILKAELWTNTIDFTPQETAHQLLTVDQALANINQNKGFLLNAYSPDEETPIAQPFDITTLQDIRLNTLQLEYRLNSEETLAIPSYHFSGTAKDSQNNTMGVEIITPAVNFTIAP